MLLDSAFPAPATIPCAALAFHRRLAEWNRSRASTVFDAPDWLTSLQAQYRMRRLEQDFVGAASASVRRFAREAPSDPERFSVWFARLDQLRSSTTDALFTRLANDASPEQLRWYLEQHAVAETGFSELSALVQQKLTPQQAESSCHGGDPLACLGQMLSDAEGREDTVWEALAVSNLMVALTANRRYAYHAAGALAAVELTAPTQREALEQGLTRLGLHGDVSALPSDFGTPRSWTWCNDVLPALVAQDPSAASQIAEGALCRLAASARYSERCNRELDQLREALESRCPPLLIQANVNEAGEAWYAN